MSVLGATTTADFVARFWQQEPLVVRTALPGVRGLIDGDDLAGFACEDAVDSRIVVGDDAGATWTGESGPFQEARFANLPARGWTLLVQGVDQWVPEIAGLLAHFDFLPRWRLDDVMVSYAAAGGGVGPHFDYYDVFLLQAEGARQWRLGQRCDEHTPLRAGADLRLLERFDVYAEYRLEPGDMLYVPPGVAHWGTALTPDCITVSVGFRAPSAGELLQDAAAVLGDAAPASRRYRDSVVSLDGDPFLINEAAIDEAERLWDSVSVADRRRALAAALGRQSTEPRHPDDVAASDEFDVARADASITSDRALALLHHPSSRFAYALDGAQATLFVDGEAHRSTPAFARGVCHRSLAAEARAAPADRALLRALLERGSLALLDG